MLKCGCARRVRSRKFKAYFLAIAVPGSNLAGKDTIKRANTMTTRKGRCLGGAVTYEYDTMPEHVIASCINPRSPSEPPHSSGECYLALTKAGSVSKVTR